MTVGELRQVLALQPQHLDVIWCNEGKVGYFYAEEQNLLPDDGAVALECGSAMDDE